MTTVSTQEVKTSSILQLQYGSYIIDNSAGNIILSLPQVISTGNVVIVTRNDTTTSVNPLTITAFGTQTINRSVSAISQANNTTLRFVSQNNGWFYGLASLPGPIGITGNTGGPPITTLTLLGNTPNANGLSVSGSSLTFQPASSAFGGAMSNTSQSIAGPKQFVDTTQAISNTNASVTFDGGIGISKQLIAGAVGDPNSLSGVLLNNNISGYTPSVLREYSEVDLPVNSLQLTGSTTLYFTRVGKRITLTINEFSGTSDGKSNLLFRPIQAPFIPDFPLTFSVWVIFNTVNLYTDLILNMDGTISLTGAQFTTTPIPAGNFTLKQTVITYNQRQANQLVNLGIQRNMPVAVSGDSNTIAIGASDDGNGVGAVYIFARNSNISNNWIQQAKVVGTLSPLPPGTTRQIIGEGTAVYLLNNGNTLYFSGRTAEPDFFGNDIYNYIIWAFTRSGLPAVWTQASVTKFQSISGISYGTNQGISISDNQATRIFKYDLIIGRSDILSPDTIFTSSFTVNSIFASASVSGDGTTLAIGDPSTNEVKVYNKVPFIGNFQWQLQATLTPSIVGSNPVVGASVAFSTNGNILIVGGPGDNLGLGAAWIFNRSTGSTGVNWSETIKLLANDSVGSANQGASVSISSDGNIAAVGGPTDNNSLGAVWLYTNSSTGYKQLCYKLRGSGYDAVTRQGSSVSIPADGSLVVTGAPRVGIAWIFVSPK